MTKRFYNLGQMNSSTIYFYYQDMLGSTRELTDNSGGIQAEYLFDPFGRVSRLSENVASDFQYAGYYIHPRSGLNLTATRTYSPMLGRFISIDTLDEKGGADGNDANNPLVNLYAYVDNDPIDWTDP